MTAMAKNLSLIIHSVRIAETQAIAIYEAELFFIRREDRRSLLREILCEEREHDEAMESQVPLGAFTLAVNRLAGWILGSFLACLPWRWMCRVQDWAEGQAAEIYEKAAIDAKAIGAPESLVGAIITAGIQERDHAAQFRRRVSETNSG